MIVDIRFRNRAPQQFQNVSRTSVTTGPKGFLLVLWVNTLQNDTVRHIFMLKDIHDTKVWND